MPTSFQFLIPPDASERLSSAAVPATARAGNPDGFVPYMVVWVNTRQVIAAWRHDDLVGYEQRDPVQLEEIFQAMTHTGNEYMPILCFTETGNMNLVDGRHRMLVFDDCEYGEVPVVVPAAQATRFEVLFGGVSDDGPVE